jgi:hypothetical protein
MCDLIYLISLGNKMITELDDSIEDSLFSPSGFFQMILSSPTPRSSPCNEVQSQVLLLQRIHPDSTGHINEHGVLFTRLMPQTATTIKSPQNRRSAAFLHRDD